MYLALVRAITPEEILAVAKRYIDTQKLIIVSAGPGTKTRGKR